MKIRNLKDKLVTLVLLAVCVLILWVFQMPCLVRAVAGITCPGCGLTRAYVCLLQLDVAGAFGYHRMFWAIPLLGVYYLTDGRLLPKKWMDVTLLSLIALGFLINWIWHLCT